MTKPIIINRDPGYFLKPSKEELAKLREIKKLNAAKKKEESQAKKLLSTENRVKKITEERNLAHIKAFQKYQDTPHYISDEELKEKINKKDENKSFYEKSIAQMSGLRNIGYDARLSDIAQAQQIVDNANKRRKGTNQLYVRSGYDFDDDEVQDVIIVDGNDILYSYNGQILKDFGQIDKTEYHRKNPTLKQKAQNTFRNFIKTDTKAIESRTNRGLITTKIKQDRIRRLNPRQLILKIVKDSNYVSNLKLKLKDINLITRRLYGAIIAQFIEDHTLRLYVLYSIIHQTNTTIIKIINKIFATNDTPNLLDLIDKTFQINSDAIFAAARYEKMEELYKLISQSIEAVKYYDRKFQHLIPQIINSFKNLIQANTTPIENEQIQDDIIKISKIIEKDPNWVDAGKDIKWEDKELEGEI